MGIQPHRAFNRFSLGALACAMLLLFAVACKPSFTIDNCENDDDCFVGEQCLAGVCEIVDEEDMVVVEDMDEVDPDMDEPDMVDMGVDMDDVEPVVTVVVTPAETTLDLEETILLTAQPKDASGNDLDRDVEFASSLEDVASVDSAGLVTAHSEGTAVITATSEGVEGTATITVAKKPVAAVDLTPNSTTLGVGETLQFTVLVTDAEGNELFAREVVWSSDDETVITVADGLVEAVGIGTTDVVATVEGVDGTATVAVEPEPVATVEVTPEIGEIEVAETLQLSGTAFDAMSNELVGRTITWMSDDTAIATVDSSGLVTGVGPGMATITGSSGAASDTASITVIPRPIASIDIIPTSVTLEVGSEAQLNATPRAADGSALMGRTISWSSDNTPVATVDTTGRVTGVSGGTAMVTAEAEGVDASVQVTVNEPVDSVVVTPDPASVLVGATVQLNADALDSMGNTLSGRFPFWSSLDTNVATVDNSTGLVTGVAAGTATIRANVDGVNGDAMVDVLEPIASVDLVSTAPGADVGEMITFTATPQDAMGNALTGRTCTYSSQDAGVVTIDSMSGVATIQGEGDTFIDADCEGVADTLAVAGYGDVALVTVNPDMATITLSDTQQFTVTLEDASGHALSGRTVTWASSDENVATVDLAGLATASDTMDGTVTITATSEGIDGTASLTVTP